MFGGIFSLLVIPVSAFDQGYSQGYMGVPKWVLNRMDTSIMPDRYYPQNTSEEGETSPTAASYISSGNDLLMSGSFADAKGAFENAINLKPKSFDAWAGRGMAYEGMKRYQSALESYEKALGFASKSQEGIWMVYAGQGRALYNLQDYEGAVTALEKAIEEYADTGESGIGDLVAMYEKLAYAREKTGDAEGASDAMEKAATLKEIIGEIEE